MTFDIFVRFVLIPAMGVGAALTLVLMAVEAFRSWRARPH